MVSSGSPLSRGRADSGRLPRLMAAALAGIALGATLGGCSDLYFDRRDSIALSAGDAVAANAVAQTIDPWPAHSGNTNIAFNGQKMQSAIERYRTGKVTPPVDTLQPTGQQQQQPGTVVNNNITSSPSGAPPSTASASAQ